MKRLFLLIIAALWGMTALLFAQTNKHVNIYAVAQFPTGGFNNYLNTGVEAGAAGNLSTKNPVIALTFGAGYLFIPGKNIVYKRGVMRNTTYNPDFKAVKVFAGTRIGKTTGVFCQPSVIGSFKEDWNKAGVELYAGYIYPVKNAGISIRAGYTMLNPFGKEGERDCNLLGVGIGVTF